MSLLINLTRLLNEADVTRLQQQSQMPNALLLSQDGVYMAKYFLDQENVYLLQDDITARAINVTPLGTTLKLISYAEFVELTLIHNTILNW